MAAEEYVQAGTRELKLRRRLAKLLVGSVQAEFPSVLWYMLLPDTMGYVALLPSFGLRNSNGVAAETRRVDKILLLTPLLLQLRGRGR